MPEGHSLHRLARQFDDVFGGQVVQVSSPQGRFSEDAARIDGQELELAFAKGKQLFCRFSNDLYLRVHLGLYGAFSFGGDGHFAGASSIGAPRKIGEREVGAGGKPEEYAGPPAPVGVVRARIVSEHGWADLRGPTACEVLDYAQVQVQLGKLGPDPLAGAAADFQASKSRSDPKQAQAVLEEGCKEFRDNLSRTKTAIGIALMNQNLISGVGNIYRAEALFRNRIAPELPANQLTSQKAKKLWLDIVTVMEDGVRDGKIITTLPEDREDGLPLWPENAYYVYQRQGMGCRRCTGKISLAEVASRKLYWCPRCQKMPRSKRAE
ncbi:DNA-formamidopyrimidine glycosylase family protein [Glutamicibacter halophytocola]|uniref:Fpg/Nei family DNA glycosylase n=1 Tax=Glutamicibacter TaxID=1742989 RepID=UPI0015C55C32|nr:DNA glycosylase [Glutamicibacter halophytocola]MBF6673323.1 Fpg/Nei family DNA glycosylase [Glutamicibacter sp. FBE19]NQD39165.1 Fpg/Nei family DNA glycosylase [Glutamicibacter halophytocola]